MKTGNDPAAIAKVIVAAAIDPKPKLRYTAGSQAGRISMLRLVPAPIFDKQIQAQPDDKVLTGRDATAAERGSGPFSLALPPGSLSGRGNHPRVGPPIGGTRSRGSSHYLHTVIL